MSSLGGNPSGLLLLAGGVFLGICLHRSLATGHGGRDSGRATAGVPVKSSAAVDRGESHAGRVVIVTGGANGIGRGICEAFASQGAHVWCLDVDEAAGTTLSMSNSYCQFFRCDAASESDIRAAVTHVAQAHGGRVDVLVNNVGVLLDNGQPAHVLEADVWDKVLAINLRSHFLFAKYCLQHMLQQSRGVIINIASVQGLQSQPGIPAYAASKGGILSLTRQLAMEYASQGIRVLAICPGSIRTPLLEMATMYRSPDKSLEEAMKLAGTAYPMRRVGRVEEVADVVVFLASDRASFCTGEYIVVDGGIMAKGGWCDVA